MSRRRTIQPTITDNDRFGLTFFLATVFHGMVILGITFSISPLADNDNTPTLDIILVQTKSPVEVEQADYLAQVSQQGGGDAEQKARPRELFSAPSLASTPGIAMQASSQQLQKQKQPEQLALVTQKQSDYLINTDKKPLRADDETSLTTSTSQNTRIARLAAEISNSLEEQASTDRTRYLNSSTKEFAPASYMREWIDRVERVGNLNYPDQARRNRLSGTLILDVVINADGQLVKTDLRQSSGHQILDDAAKRIVKLAAPFPAFSQKLREQADVIHITRSWEFLHGSNLRTH